MRRDLVILLLLLSGLRLSAQEPDSTSVVREPDNSLIGKASRLIGNASAWFQDLTPVKIFNARDTSYYSVPPGDWTIKVRSNLTGPYLSARGHSDDRNFTTRLAARHNLTHSIGVTYKGVTLGYTFSPWQRDGHDIRYDFSAYSNMAGIDATYRTISSFSGYAEADGERLGEIAENQASQHILSINTFYFFNYKQFSFPASINQSYYQLKSAGSWIAGLSYTLDQTSVPSVGGSLEFNVNSRLVALGGGYGYTWVPKRKGWQVMIAVLPKLVVYDSGHLKLEYDDEGRARPVGYDIRQALRQPEATLNGYFAAVHWFRRYFFLGLTASLDGYSIGNYGTYTLTQFRWEAHLALGARF